MKSPELILGFRRVGDELLVIGPEGEGSAFRRGELFDEISRRITEDGVPGIVTNSVDATEERLRSAYGVLYGFVRAQATQQVGEGVVMAAETVAKRAHRKAEQALAGAPRGPSRKYRLRQQRKAAGAGGS